MTGQPNGRTMTSRDRFLNSLLCKPVDRLFRYEHGPWPTTRQRWIGEGYPADADFADFFAMDPLVRIGIRSGYTDSPYYPSFEKVVHEDHADYQVVTGGDGVVKKEFKVGADTSMPQFLKFPVTDRGDWEKVRERLRPADATGRVGDATRWARRCIDQTVPTMLPICGAFGHPRNLFGDENLSYALYDTPDLIDEILENWLDLYVSLLRELCRTVRVDTLLIWEDMCYRGGPLISPEHFRRFMLPGYCRLIEVARSCGVQAIIVDTDGDCLPMIPLFLEAGADCLMPFEVQAGMDVVRIGRQYPNLAIMGGLDKRALAVGRAAIRAEVDRVLPAMLERGGFIPTLDHTVPPDVPLENFGYYLECVRAYEGR